MQPKLYFDISSTETGGSLYQLKHDDGSFSFVYHHSTYDEYRDEIRVFKTPYSSFDAFWEQLTKDREWFYLHPLFVHPEIRAFVKEQLTQVNWQVQGDQKWQESHQRQWRKVLSDPTDYYNSL
jgi:hypothetical protein